MDKLDDLVERVTRMEERVVTHDDFTQYRSELRSNRRWAIGASLSSVALLVSFLSVYGNLTLP